MRWSWHSSSTCTHQGNKILSVPGTAVMLGTLIGDALALSCSPCTGLAEQGVDVRPVPNTAVLLADALVALTLLL